MAIFLESQRLVLKQHELADFANLLALRSDPDVMKYIGDGSTQTVEQVKLFLQTTIAYQQKHGIGFCSVFEKQSGNFIGQAGLFHLQYSAEQPEIEIAYRLHKAYWGKGYATELAKALIRWGFQHLSIDKLVAVVDPDNIASQKVLKKAGLDFRDKRKWHNGREVLWFEIYKTDAIELVPYNTGWPKLAKIEIKKLLAALPKSHILDIQHVGSTAIPHLLAKPIIDIQIAVDSLTAVKPIAINRLKTLDYVYWDENPDPERLFFVKGMPPFGEKRTHHVHIFEPGSKHWKNKILFRDYLILHPALAYQYEELKRSLAAQHTYDREQYTEAKANFVSKILKNAAEDSALSKQSLNIVFLTGASGAGKTSILDTIQAEMPNISCFHFDSIGVPSEAEIVNVYGSGSEWQKAMTYHWAKKLINDSSDKKLIILEGQVNLDFIIAAFEGFNFHRYKIILVHCENAVRHKRLREMRNQPELINDEMDDWALFLKKQALEKGAIVFDTTSMDVNAMIYAFKNLLDANTFR